MNEWKSFKYVRPDISELVTIWFFYNIENWLSMDPLLIFLIGRRELG